MTRQKGIVLSILSVILGYLSLYLSWGILPGPTFSTLALLLGIGLVIFGIVMFVISANKN